MIVAITGCIGSGKTFISNKINKLYGYDVFSSDEFVKLAYENIDIQNKLDKRFNCLIDNKIDKQIIKDKLDEDSIKDLNNIIHPFVINKIKEIKNTYLKSLTFVEVPLLFESNLAYLFDYTISISVEESLRHERLKKRCLENYQDMIKLEKYQLSNEQKANLADFVLVSLKNEDDTLANLDVIISKIVKR